MESEEWGALLKLARARPPFCASRHHSLFFSSAPLFVSSRDHARVCACVRVCCATAAVRARAQPHPASQLMAGASPPRRPSPTRRPTPPSAPTAPAVASHSPQRAPLRPSVMAAPTFIPAPGPTPPTATFSVDDIRITAPNVEVADLPDSVLKKDCVLFYHPVSLID